jgi:hypothetical protein
MGQGSGRPHRLTDAERLELQLRVRAGETHEVAAPARMPKPSRSRRSSRQRTWKWGSPGTPVKLRAQPANPTCGWPQLSGEHACQRPADGGSSPGSHGVQTRLSWIQPRPLSGSLIWTHSPCCDRTRNDSPHVATKRT